MIYTYVIVYTYASSFYMQLNLICLRAVESILLDNQVFVLLDIVGLRCVQTQV